MDNLQLTTMILAIALIIACCYIITENVDFCEQAKNESYNAGYDDGEDYGIEFWNNEVITNMIKFDIVPYWVNNSRYYVNLTLMIKEECGEQNG